METSISTRRGPRHSKSSIMQQEVKKVTISTRAKQKVNSSILTRMLMWTAGVIYYYSSNPTFSPDHEIHITQREDLFTRQKK